MVNAYILIQTEVGKAAQVTEQIRGMGGVVAVDPVTGPYDVVARAEADDLDQLAKSTVMPMQELEGITRTLTCPVLPAVATRALGLRGAGLHDDHEQADDEINDVDGGWFRARWHFSFDSYCRSRVHAVRHAARLQR